LLIGGLFIGGTFGAAVLSACDAAESPPPAATEVAPGGSPSPEAVIPGEKATQEALSRTAEIVGISGQESLNSFFEQIDLAGVFRESVSPFGIKVDATTFDFVLVPQAVDDGGVVLAAERLSLNVNGSWQELVRREAANPADGQNYVVWDYVPETESAALTEPVLWYRADASQIELLAFAPPTPLASQINFDRSQGLGVEIPYSAVPEDIQLVLAKEASAVVAEPEPTDEPTPTENPNTRFVEDYLGQGPAEITLLKESEDITAQILASEWDDYDVRLTDNSEANIEGVGRLDVTPIQFLKLTHKQLEKVVINPGTANEKAGYQTGLTFVYQMGGTLHKLVIQPKGTIFVKGGSFDAAGYQWVEDVYSEINPGDKMNLTFYHINPGGYFNPSGYVDFVKNTRGLGDEFDDKLWFHLFGFGEKNFTISDIRNRLSNAVAVFSEEVLIESLTITD